jgi:hypothetical protein
VDAAWETMLYESLEVAAMRSADASRLRCSARLVVAGSSVRENRDTGESRCRLASPLWILGPEFYDCTS